MNELIESERAITWALGPIYAYTMQGTKCTAMDHLRFWPDDPNIELHRIKIQELVLKDDVDLILSFSPTNF